jgi:prepilin-type N-terminal cleavage/methylation domain-containing protein
MPFHSPSGDLVVARQESPRLVPVGRPTFARPSTTARAGFTLTELMIVTMVIGLLASIAAPKVNDVLVRAHVNSIVADGKLLYTGFQEFHASAFGYPNSTSNPAFNLVTFEPLRSMGYYQGNTLERLNNQQADSYNSPDDEGPNQEFWVQLTLRIDPSYQVVIASSDNAPLAPGQWLEGVYTFKDGVLIAGPGVSGS